MHFDGDDQKNTILPQSNAMSQIELFQGNQTRTVFLKIILNSFQSTSLSIRSTVQ